MATRPARKSPPKRPAVAWLAPDAGTEARLHADSVKAGAAAALQVALESLPLLKPLVPTRLRRAGSAESVDSIQRRLVEAIYRNHGLTPARWELEGILAVAQSQSALSPLASRKGLKSLLEAWLPGAISTPLLRYTPLETLVIATTRAIAGTWAAGRYADSVCRLRKAGADWLPAPLAEALSLAPSTLRAWSAEALSLAMPPLRMAGALGRGLAAMAGNESAATGKPLPRRSRATAKRKPQ